MDNWQIWHETLLLIILSAMIIPIHVVAIMTIRKEQKELAKRRSDLLTVMNIAKGRSRNGNYHKGPK